MVYFTTWKTYSGYTLQEGEPTQGILYNKENLLRVYYTTWRTYPRVYFTNMENLLRVYFITRRIFSAWVYFTTRKTCSGYSFQQGERAQGILYNKENVLRV